MEKIVIDVIEVGKNCIYRSSQGKSRTLCTHNGLMEQVTLKDCKNCVEGITKQEAIEVMAKALCHRYCPEKVCTCCDEWEKYGTKEDAEAVLNALLER